ncbi:MAG: amino acid-binding protein [Oscillospiraceae bacterium]|jgi:hypothetical protein|nr:amino acid-binding protein [Oscillospiraceae bacterium]
MTIEQLSVFVENKSGKLVQVLKTLGDAGIDLRAMSIADTSDFGILRLIVDEPGRAHDILRAAGYVVILNNVLPLAIDDAPGSLAGVLGALSEAAIGVEYVYAFVAHGGNRAHVILRTTDDKLAASVLKARGVAFVPAGEILRAPQ